MYQIKFRKYIQLNDFPLWSYHLNYSMNPPISIMDMLTWCMDFQYHIRSLVLKLVYVCRTCTRKNKHTIHGPKIHYAYWWGQTIVSIPYIHCSCHHILHKGLETVLTKSIKRKRQWLYIVVVRASIHRSVHDDRMYLAPTPQTFVS